MRSLELLLGENTECEVDDDPCNGPLEPNTQYWIWYQLHYGDAVADYDFEVVLKTGMIMYVLSPFHILYNFIL